MSLIFDNCLDQKSDLFRVRECSGTMSNLTILLRETNRLSKAESPILDALSILRKSQKEQPEVFSRFLVVTLNSYTILLEQAGISKEAETSLREAITLLGNFTPESSLVYRQYLSIILSNLAFLLRNAGKQSEADIALQKAANLIDRSDKMRVEVM